MGQHNENPLEELRYWETKSVDELVMELEELYDFEQAPDILTALEKKAPVQAVKMGADIIKYDRGDQFLQACVFSNLFDPFGQAMLQAAEERRKPMEWCFLGAVVHELMLYRDRICPSPRLLEKMLLSYALSDRKEEIDQSEWRAFLDCYHLRAE